VAGTDASVLISGETGTGKELVARAIHARSPRKDRPLVKVNCAALAPGLVESELFGHEKGAFTGASERRTGRFELADGGTIFLDEVGEIPLETQVKLLRVLQEREFERAGGSQTLRVDVRVIAATNRDLEKTIAEGKFRQDLFYRLNVFPLRVPPLRERKGDVPLLVHHFAQRHAARVGRPIAAVSDATLELLVRYPWPGNVRELENVIERAVILARGPVLEIDPAVLGLPAAEPAGPNATPSADLSLAELERRRIVEVLSATGWRIEGEKGAAGRLGLHPNTLRSRIKKLRIRRSDDAREP
jgi:transcriptional regulator with GAF, ATPase, and Fis domain